MDSKLGLSVSLFLYEKGVMQVVPTNGVPRTAGETYSMETR